MHKGKPASLPRDHTSVPFFSGLNRLIENYDIDNLVWTPVYAPGMGCKGFKIRTESGAKFTYSLEPADTAAMTVTLVEASDICLKSDDLLYYFKTYTAAETLQVLWID